MGPTAAEWEQVTDIPRFRQEHSAVSVDDRFIYLIGGVEPDLQTTVPIDRYDTLTGEWEPAYDALPADRTRNHFNAIVYEGEVYLAGGKISGDGTGREWFDKWNPATKEWTALPDLPEIHWGGPAILHGDRLHVVSGAVSRLEATTHHFAIDLTATDMGWSELPEIPEASVHAGGFALNDKLYVVGGESTHSHPDITEEREVFVFDPLLGVWDHAPDFPIVRHHADWSTFVYDGAAYSVSGADNEQSPRGQDAIYVSEDPSAPDSWTQPLPSLPKPLIGPSALVVDDRLWVMGGWDSEWEPENRVRDAWALDLSQVMDNPADLDGNGVVDASDYAAWADAYAAGNAGAAGFTSWRDVVQVDAGDFDRNGRFDQGDFAVWAASYGQSGAPPHGDANRDGAVNGADYTVWRDAEAKNVLPVDPIPEPAALALVAMALVVFSARGTVAT